METDRFSVDRSNEEERPTAVMLSHVYELKGVMDAIRAAAVIVQKYGLVEYQLLIYGSLDKDPTYVSECRALISANNLQENVSLMGLGNAPKVLTRGWIFVNSSLSEGLPLALGEAGLCGMPVVCTDVGGSREVISKYLTNGDLLTYGRVVPPRNPNRLAQAQLETMAMLGGLQELVSSIAVAGKGGASGASGASGHNTPKAIPRSKKGGSINHNRPYLQLSDYKDGSSLLNRIQSQMKNRRLLGMKFREFVLSNFTMSRYLREHYATMAIAHSIYVARAASDRHLGNNNEQNLDALIQSNDADIAVIRDELLASKTDRRSLKSTQKSSLEETMGGMFLKSKEQQKLRRENEEKRKRKKEPSFTNYNSDNSDDSSSSSEDEGTFSKKIVIVLICFLLNFFVILFLLILI